MLLLLQLDLRPLPVRRAIFEKLAEVRFLGFHDTAVPGASTAFCAITAVDCSLTSWHSRDTLLGEGKERKTSKDDRKSSNLHEDAFSRKELLGGKFRGKFRK